MIECSLTDTITPSSPLQVLCLGAHSDDLEIGCGGAILKLSDEKNPLDVTWIVFSANGERRREAIESANLLLSNAAKKDVVVKDFRDGFFPYVGGEIKDYFEALKKRISPDLIFTHYRHDLHQDHRVVSELTWNTFRDHLILEYEIPKYDGDLGSPNVFVPLPETICKRKIQHILDCFTSQGDNQWFGEDTFLAIMRLRGIESNAPTKFAEAFYSRKIILR